MRLQDSGIVIGAVLAALAFGVAVPRRVAVSVCARTWNRFVRYGPRSAVPTVLVADEVDRPLYWTVLAVIALAGGVAWTLLPLVLPLTAVVSDRLWSRFVWSDPLLWAVQAAVCWITCLVPMGLLGLALSCAHHLCCRFGKWDARATGWILIGAFGGAIAARAVQDAGWPARTVLIGASVPLFVVALAAAVFCNAATARNPGRIPSAMTSSLPAWSDGWPRLLRASIVAVGGGVAVLIVVWAGRLDPVHRAWTQHLMVASTGIGYLLGCRRDHASTWTIGSFGVAVAVAGLTVALTSTGLQPAMSPTVLPVLCSCLATSVVGFATAVGRQALLARVACRSLAGAQVLSRLLLCGAVSLWMAVPLSRMLVGDAATVMIFALSLIAVGGMLIIHEPADTPATRRTRLWAVFGSVATLIILAASPSNPWREDPPHDASAPAATAEGIAPFEWAIAERRDTPTTDSCR